MTIITRRSALGGMAAAVALVGRVPAAQAQALRLTVSAGHPPVFLWVQELQKFFIPEVTKRLSADGKLTIQWNEGYGGTIAKIGGELDALRDGLADLGIVGTIFHAADHQNSAQHQRDQKRPNRQT